MPSRNEEHMQVIDKLDLTGTCFEVREVNHTRVMVRDVKQVKELIAKYPPCLVNREYEYIIIEDTLGINLFIIKPCSITFQSKIINKQLDMLGDL